MILETIGRLAREEPEKFAAAQGADRYSYRQLARWIGATHTHLQNLNLPSQGVAAICTDRLLDAWVLGLALRSLGLTTVVVRDAPHLRQLQLTGVVCVVGVTADEQPRSDTSSDGLPLILVPKSLERRSDGPLPDLKPATGGNIMTTSGTTGQYKKVLRSTAAESLLIPLHARINAIDERSVVYVCNFDQTTAGGYRWPLITWSLGGAVIFHQGKDEHRPLLEHEMTHLFATPMLLMQMLRKPAGELRRNDATRVLVTGGAMTRAQAQAVRQRISARLFSVLASTEALTLSVTPVEIDEDLHRHRIHPEREVQVVDADDRRLPPGQEGQVRARILDGLTGYLDDADATRRYFKDDWFYPGDLGVLHADGRLSLHGRASDVINLLGNKIATAPIEQVLQDRLDATAVCILSVPSAGADDTIHIVYESKDTIPADRWRTAITQEFPLLQKVPLQTDRVKAMPRNAMGKILRVQLRQQLQTVMDSQQ